MEDEIQQIRDLLQTHTSCFEELKIESENIALRFARFDRLTVRFAMYVCNHQTEVGNLNVTIWKLIHKFDDLPEDLCGTHRQCLRDLLNLTNQVKLLKQIEIDWENRCDKIYKLLIISDLNYM